MQILHSLPKDDGFHMPAEFEAHLGCILIWPERRDSWQFGAYAARKAFSKLVNAISLEGHEKVTVACSHSQYKQARACLDPSVRVIEMSSDDSWARDIGPSFVINNDGLIRGINWSFNAWGGLYSGLYFPWDKDDDCALKLCDLYDADAYDASDFVLEGGSIHSNGQGLIMTTEACLLSKGRNPDLSREEIEKKLCSYLGAEEVLWLPRGIYNDETDEHVDNIAAFAAKDHVLIAYCDDESDPQYELSHASLKAIEAYNESHEQKLKITKLPMPYPITMREEECQGLDNWGFEPTRTPGERLAASYANFYIANDSVLMPGFANEERKDSPDYEIQHKRDAEALSIMKEAFPDRKVIMIYARDILIGGGNIHCITQQVPKKA